MNMTTPPSEKQTQKSTTNFFFVILHLRDFCLEDEGREYDPVPLVELAEKFIILQTHRLDSADHAFKADYKDVPDDHDGNGPHGFKAGSAMPARV